MYVSICHIPIQLKTDSPTIQKEWRDIFECHLTEPCNPEIIIEAFSLDKAPAADPQLPKQMFAAEFGSYTLAHTPDGQTHLTLASGAIVCLPNITQPWDDVQSVSASIFISPAMISLGQAEDVTLTLLAPIMRRFGIYIVHAFGAAHPTKNIATLIIGRSGQGKTTTGLFLIKEGWRYLSNDAVFLSQDNAGHIVAWPSPGRVNIHPDTLSVLGNPSFLDADSKIGADGKHHLNPSQIPNHLKQPMPVTVQLFPTITKQAGDCRFQKIPAGIALTQTMTQSTDNWDKLTFEAHFSFLEKLIAQSQSYQTFNSIDLSSLTQGLAKRC